MKWRENWNKKLGILEERMLTIERFIVEQRKENKKKMEEAVTTNI